MSNNLIQTGVLSPDFAPFQFTRTIAPKIVSEVFFLGSPNAFKTAVGKRLNVFASIFKRRGIDLNNYRVINWAERDLKEEAQHVDRLAKRVLAGEKIAIFARPKYPEEAQEFARKIQAKLPKPPPQPVVSSSSQLSAAARKTYSMDFRRLTYPVQGQFLRARMPFNIKQGIEELKRLKVTHVALLLEDQEKRGLCQAYEEAGLTVLHCPIKDFGIPEEGPFTELINDLELLAQDANNRVVIHCKGGRGRTGMVAAALAKRLMQYEGKEAIAWVRKTIPGAVETPPQERFVENFEKKKVEQHPPVAPRPLELCHIPLKRALGKIYCGNLPSPFLNKTCDPFESLKREKISTVVLLTIPSEYLRITGVNLIQKYQEHGFEVEPFPILETDIPSRTEAILLMKKLEDLLLKGKNLLLQCSDGQGRAGLLAGSLVKRLDDLETEVAIAKVKRYLPNAFQNELHGITLKHLPSIDKKNEKNNGCHLC